MVVPFGDQHRPETVRTGRTTSGVRGGRWRNAVLPTAWFSTVASFGQSPSKKLLEQDRVK